MTKPDFTELGTTFKVLSIICRIGNQIGGCPYEWDKRKHGIYPTKSKLKMLTWGLLGCYVWINAGFMMMRLSHAYCCMKVSYGVLFMNLFSVISFTATALSHLNTLLRFHDIPTCVNQIIGVNRHFDELRREDITTVPDTTKDWDSRTPAGKIMILMYTFSFTQFFLAVRRGSQNPKYWLTLLDNPAELPKIVKLLFAVFECFVSAHCTSMMGLYIVFNLAYSRSMARCLETLTSCQSPTKSQELYRTLQLLNSRFGICCHSIVQPLLTFGIFFGNMVSGYATFKLFGDVHMPGYLAFPAAYISTGLIAKSSLTMSGDVFERSRKFIKTMVHQKQSSLAFAKFLKSCRPLRVWVGEMYFIRKSSVRVFYANDVDSTVFLLLTF